MAISRSRLRSRSGPSNANEELLALLMEQYGAKAQPKARPLERIFASFRALGSVPDAYYRAKYEGANPFATYGKNLLGSLGTTFLGTPQKEYKEASDIAMREGALLGQDPGTKFARSALDIGASIVTNPLTYVGFGPAKLAASLTKPASKAALTSTKKLPLGAKKADRAASELAKLVEGKPLSEALSIVSKNKKYGEEVASAFHDALRAHSGIMTKTGAQLPSLKAPGSVKFMGQQITDAPWAGEAVKTAINPFYALGKGGGALGKKLAPHGMRKAQARLYDVFAPTKAAAMAGPGQFAAAREALLQKGKEATVSGAAKGAIAERAHLIRGGLSDAEKSKVVQYSSRTHIDEKTGAVMFQKLNKDGTMEAIPLAKSSISEKLKEYLRLNAQTEFSESARQLQSQLKDPRHIIPVTRAKDGTEFGAVKSDLLKPTKKGSLADLLKPGIKEKAPYPIDMAGGRGDRLLGQKRAGDIFKDVGLLDPYERTYGLHDIKRISKAQIKNLFPEDVAKDLLGSPKIKAELSKNRGKANMETVQELAQDLGVFRPSGTRPGMNMQNLLQRKYPTIESGQAAGIDYELNPIQVLQKQAEKQIGRLDGHDFGRTLNNMVDDRGASMFSKAVKDRNSEAIDLPGVGRRFTDRKTKRVLENYFDAFSADTGLDETLKGLDKVTYEWKGYVTAKGPGFIQYHIRNYLDDNIRMVLGGAKVGSLPKDYRIAREALALDREIKRVGEKAALKNYSPKHADDIAAYLKQTGRTPDKSTTNNVKMLLDEFREKGVYSDVAKSKSEAFGAGWDKMQPRETVEDFFTFKGRLTDEEQARRIAMYTNVFRQKGNSAEAQQAVRDVLFNYLELGKAERVTGRRIIPFYSFLKNNIKFQFETMFHDPQAYSKFVHVMDGLQSGFIGPDKDKYDAMPEWMRRRYSIPIGEKEGELHMLTNLGLSFDDLEEMDLQGILGKINPALKVPIELATGQSLFHRAPIEDVMKSGRLYRDHPLRGLMGYREEERDGWTQETVNPYARYWAENTPFLGQANLLARNIGRTTGPGLGRGDWRESAEALFDWKIPGKIHKRNIESGAKRREIEDLDALYQILYQRGEADKFSRYYIPADIRDRLIREMGR